MKKIKVGIIGCGTIGTSIIQAIRKKFHSRLAIAAICDHHPKKIEELKRKAHFKAVLCDIDEVIKKSDIVIEAASAEASLEIVKKALRKHKKVLVMSVGGLLKGRGLESALKSTRGKLWVPSGAISGLDGLLAASEATLKQVKLITRKPPKGLLTAPFFKTRKFPKLNKNQEKCIFKGTAFQAVKYFPQNINVAAVLSLAGLGAKRTRVEIWTSKKYRSNQHEVVIESSSGTIRTVTTNKPAPGNPKTSYLAVLAAVATLRKIISNCRLGT